MFQGLEHKLYREKKSFSSVEKEKFPGVKNLLLIEDFGKICGFSCVIEKLFIILQSLIMKRPDTNKEFQAAMAECREIFSKKLYDYKPSWRMLRPSSLTDQLFIKAKRIRTLEVTGESLVGEGILPEFMALINYGIIGLIQLRKGYADKVDMTNDEAMALYDEHARECLELMQKKNHDYGEAWRDMRVSSYTDIILTKLERIKEIEDKNGVTIASEGIDSNIMDIINYSVFAVIKLSPLPQEA